MKRIDGRGPRELRPIKITPNYINAAAGSVLIEMGATRVLCAASIEESVPRWMKGQGRGWITGEYSMLPYAGGERRQRESSAGRIGGRTHEIQRLIGRAFRGIADLSGIGERTIWLDCDVLEADGGTRTASINGAFIALMMALNKLLSQGMIATIPVKDQVAAVSVGVYEGIPILDLCYEEDSKADVDMNIVMTRTGKFIELQGTAEHEPFSEDILHKMIQLARSGIKKIFQVQMKSIPSAGVPLLR